MFAKSDGYDMSIDYSGIGNKVTLRDGEMETGAGYYHMYANGDDAKEFVICEEDYKYQFNLVGVCAYNSDIQVLAFSIEDSHPHFFLFGTRTGCMRFKSLYENATRHHIASTRGGMDGVVFECELDRLKDIDHIMSVGTYVITQPTKDGKWVMPYDYRWGTGSMYFRMDGHVPIWLVSEGEIKEPVPIISLSYEERQKIRGSRMHVPDGWLVCDGLILPDNYVNVKMFEDIYKTPNCFRTFLTRGKAKDAPIIERMAASRGVSLEDHEARTLTERICMEMYGKRTARWLDAHQRLVLAREIKKSCRLSWRQLSTFCRIPESELRKYL